MAVINQVGNALTGSTGSGAFVGANTPTLITPVIGAATGTSLAFSPTTGGIIGTTTNDSAGAGYVGEVISSSVVAGSAISLTTSTVANVTCISLTAGDWDVNGVVQISGTATAMLLCGCGVSITSATRALSSDTNGSSAFDLTAGAPSAVGDRVLSAAGARISLSATTTVYLVAQATFSGGTGIAWGRIVARRAR